MADPLAQALQSLPHGPEFRFLDRLTTLDPGKSGSGEYRVQPDEPFLRGHFPGAPLFPGVLLIEAGAQLAGIVGQSDPRIPALPGLKLAAVRNVKFLGSAAPGDLIEFNAVVTGRLENLIQVQTTASVAGKLIMTGEMTLSGEKK